MTEVTQRQQQQQHETKTLLVPKIQSLKNDFKYIKNTILYLTQLLRKSQLPEADSFMIASQMANIFIV